MLTKEQKADIIYAYCAGLSVGNPDKTHKGLNKSDTRTRFISYYIMHELFYPKLNLTAIANAFGRKHNASVADGIRIIKAEILEDKALALKLFKIINYFKQMFGV